MKRQIHAAVVIGLLVYGASALGGCAESGQQFTIERKTVNNLPTVTATDSAWAQVKVEAIDYTNRSISLLGPDGKSQIFSVTSDVRNFQQIKKGDTVKAEYMKRVKATVRKVNEPPATYTGEGMAAADLGQKPGVVCVRRATVHANVESIDHGTRELKLRDESGEVTTLTANKKLKDLYTVQPGDQVVFEYMEVVALYVQ